MRFFCLGCYKKLSIMSNFLTFCGLSGLEYDGFKLKEKWWRHNVQLIKIEVIQNVTYFITIKKWFSTDHFLVKHFGIYYSCSWVRRPGMKNDDAITCIPSKMKLFKIWHVIYQSKNNSVLKDLGFYYSFTSVRGFEMKNDNVRIWKIRHYNRLMSVALYY